MLFAHVVCLEHRQDRGLGIAAAPLLHRDLVQLLGGQRELVRIVAIRFELEQPLDVDLRRRPAEVKIADVGDLRDLAAFATIRIDLRDRLHAVIVA
jgi:hypothetical protein